MDSLSEMNINTKHLTARLEHEEALHQLYIERLPGTVKTKWALGHKMNMDLAIIEALNQKEVTKEKVKTKGRF